MSLNRKTKRLLQLEERFQAGVAAYLETLGARPARSYKLELDTPAGLLHVSVYGRCRRRNRLAKSVKTWWKLQGSSPTSPPRSQTLRLELNAR